VEPSFRIAEEISSTQHPLRNTVQTFSFTNSGSRANCAAEGLLCSSLPDREKEIHFERWSKSRGEVQVEITIQSLHYNSYMARTSMIIEEADD